MKVAIFIATCIGLCAANANLLVPGDNTGYVEGESRYIWMPDGEGVPHLVDLHKPVDEEFLNARNGYLNDYWLYTRENPLQRQVLFGNEASIRASNFKANRPTIFTVHGWFDGGNSEMNREIRTELFKVLDCNVIVVNWNRFAGEDYTTAVAAVLIVGDHLGDFVNFLSKTTGSNLKNLHLVGFGLGAHVVGIAGRKTGGLVGRVTGLNPSGPLWSGNPYALNKNSGRYVEVIHTHTQYIGIAEPIGHADFYPNGGKNPQPGCFVLSPCSHSRATEIFAATVRYDHLVGRRCSSLEQAEASNCLGERLNMGNAIVDQFGEGIYAVKTGAEWPF